MSVGVSEVLGFVGVLERDGRTLAYGWGFSESMAQLSAAETARMTDTPPDRIRCVPAGFFGVDVEWPIEVTVDDHGVAWRAGEHVPADGELAAALGRSGGFMLGVALSGKTHVFEGGRMVSRCGTVLRSMARASEHRNNIAAIGAGADVCRSCCRAADEIGRALGQGVAA